MQSQDEPSHPQAWYLCGLGMAIAASTLTLFQHSKDRASHQYRALSAGSGDVELGPVGAAQ